MIVYPGTNRTRRKALGKLKKIFSTKKVRGGLELKLNQSIEKVYNAINPSVEKWGTPSPSSSYYTCHPIDWVCHIGTLTPCIEAVA